MQQTYNPDSKKANASNKSSNMEYNPLAGVSFKQNHTSDVEIVGVKLGNQNGQDSNNNNSYSNNNIAQKKKNSLKSKIRHLNKLFKTAQIYLIAFFVVLNDSPLFNGEKENGNPDLLDIVGRGYNNNGEPENNYNNNFNDKKLFDNSNDYVPTISDVNRLVLKLINYIM
jgi:hypothetical protein